MATPRAAEHRDLEQRLRDIESGLRRLTGAALRRPQFEVSSGDLTISGGNLTVDGGDFLLLDTDGSTVFRLGPQDLGDRGVSVFREDGSLVWTSSQPFVGFAGQTFRVLDRDGNVLLEESPFGVGHDAPFQALPMQPIGTAGTSVTCGPAGLERSTTSGTFTTLFQWAGRRENPFGRFKFNVRTSDTTTSAELQVVDVSTGTALQGFLVGSGWLGTVATGSSANRTVEPPYGLALPGGYLDQITVGVQVRRTAGAGTVNLAVVESQGGNA